MNRDVQPFFRRINFFGPRPTDGTTEAPDPVPPRRPASGPGLWRYLASERYADTVIHGLFHFVVIMLAFVVANVWASREAAMQDIQGQYAVLILLENELTQLQLYAARQSMKPLTPCKDGFSSDYWSTKRWDSMRPEDLSHLLANRDFYDKLSAVYDDVRSRASKAASVTTPADCGDLWAGASNRLGGFLATMIAHRNNLQREHERYQGYRGLVSATNLRIYAWTLAALTVVVVLPVALRAVENVLRRLLGTFGAIEDSAKGLEPPPAPTPPAAVGDPPPPNPAAASPQAPMAGGATTTGSR